MSDCVIQVENLSKTFKISKNKSNTLKDFFLHPVKSRKKIKFQALDNINFEIKKGDWVGILGKNGSGKSTLLKILAGVYQADEGAVRITGKIIPFLELGVGFNSELSARENIFLNGCILGLSKKEIEEKFDEIVDFAEVRKFLDTPVKNFSSGMKVRLAFAIAIQADGDIYLLDEVLAVGDLAFQRKSMACLLEFKKRGKTILFVSHCQDDILKFCNKAFLLEGSKIVAQGIPTEVVGKYNYIVSQEQITGLNREKSNGVRWGTGDVRIVEIKMKNQDDKDINLVKSGMSVVIKVNYELFSKVDLLNIGIGIYRDDGTYCLGLNTEMDAIKVAVDKKQNFLNLHLQELPLLSGSYYLNVVAFGYQEKNAFDWRGKVFRFVVVGDEKYRGLFKIKHKWDF